MERWAGAQRGASHPGDRPNTHTSLGVPTNTHTHTHTRASGETGTSVSNDPSLALAGVGGTGLLVGRSSEQGLTLEK